MPIRNNKTQENNEKTCKNNEKHEKNAQKHEKTQENDIKTQKNMEIRMQNAIEARELLKEAAKVNLADFAEVVFDYDNSKHHQEWYNILMNKLMSPKDGDMDAELVPAPKGWINERIGVMAPRSHAKALKLDTKVYTENGSETIKNIKIGQKIIGNDGKLTKIIGKSPIFHKKCYEIVFSNGETITASEDHLWSVITKSKSDYYSTAKTITTSEVKVGMLLPHIEPITSFTKKHYDIDPYTLGVWLGDGTSSSGSVTTPDDFIMEKIHGYRVGSRLLVRVPNLTSKLRKCNLKGNKHIPDIYQYGDYEQRRSLICGLMDTDGTVMHDGTYQFDNTNLQIIKGMQKLLRSFGVTANIRKSKGRYKRNGEIIECKDTYRLQFQSDIDFFTLPRKLNKHRKGTTRKRYIRIEIIREVESTPTQCLMVDNESKLFLCGETYLPTHNSSCFTVVYPLWVIGNNPNIRILIVSNSASQAQAFLREIKDKITKNSMYKEMFGDLFPEDSNEPGEKWTNQEIIVRRKATHKDPTVSAMGAGGAILSKRADIIICDDILNLENTRIAAQRENIKQWYNEVLMPVLEPNGILINVGTAWNLEDLLHEQLKNPSYDVRKRYKAILPDGTALWQERWSIEKLMELKEEVGSVAFNKSYMNEALSSEDSVFKYEWLQKAKEIGKKLSFAYTYRPESWTLPVQPKAIALGVDLAISDKDSGDYTAFAVVAELMNGAKIPLWLEEAKLDFAKTERKIIELCGRYQCDIVVVENNGYQAALVRDLQGKTSLPIVPYSTGGEKYDLNVGINSLAVEFENEKWILPYNTQKDSNGDLPSPFTVKFVDRLCDYMMRFGSGHTGDLLMATWFANGGLRQLTFNKSGEEGYAYGSKVDILHR